MHITFLGTILLLSTFSLTQDLQFSHVYRADELPEDATPQWVLRGDHGEVTLKDGLLHVETSGSARRHFYAIGKSPQGHASSAWNMDSGVATVEFRFKGESEDPKDEVFRVSISDGEKFWQVRFFNQRCNNKTVDIRDWDTYRLAIQDGVMQISSKNQGIIATDVPAAPHERSPSLIFGSFKVSTIDTTRSWSLDFIRWTTEKAMIHP